MWTVVISRIYTSEKEYYSLPGLQSHLPSTAEMHYRKKTKVNSLVEASEMTYKILTGQNNQLVTDNDYKSRVL